MPITCSKATGKEFTFYSVPFLLQQTPARLQLTTRLAWAGGMCWGWGEVDPPLPQVPVLPHWSSSLSLPSSACCKLRWRFNTWDSSPLPPPPIRIGIWTPWDPRVLSAQLCYPLPGTQGGARSLAARAPSSRCNWAIPARGSVAASWVQTGGRGSRSLRELERPSPAGAVGLSTLPLRPQSPPIPPLVVRGNRTEACPLRSQSTVSGDPWAGSCPAEAPAGLAR